MDQLLMLPLGIGLTAYSIYAIIQSKDKPESCAETYTDEEVAQAEAEMDAMYFKKHGEWPGKPKPETPNSEDVKTENSNTENSN